MSDKVTSQAYNSVWQLRADAWSSLEETSSKLAGLLVQGQPVDRVRGEVGELLGQLEPIEQYWGFPGQQRFDRLIRLFTAADYDRLARSVAGINRALVTDSFRDG